MKAFIIAALTVLSLGVGVANAASTGSAAQQHQSEQNTMLDGQGG